jgi:hypothetical protein
LFTKSDKRVEQVLSGGEGIGISERVEKEEKGHGRVNMVQIPCTHVCKWKNETCRKYSMNEVWGDEGE